MSIKQVSQDMTDNRRKPENDSLSLLIYRLDELKALVEAGFVKQESRVTNLEGRVGNLESWRAAKDAVAAANGQTKDDSLMKDKLFQIIFYVLLLLAGVLGVNITGILK